jgi:murein DD-endopeptidase MepM/ murein hydrolase activator NlpD
MAPPDRLSGMRATLSSASLGNGRFAFYAHLQPDSIRVKVGDRVRRGQVIGLLGNSGNSDGPHLHFQISDANSGIVSEGLPYVFQSFDVLGTANLSEIVAKGSSATVTGKPAKRLQEIPIENAVLRFE